MKSIRSDRIWALIGGLEQAIANCAYDSTKGNSGELYRKRGEARRLLRDILLPSYRSELTPEEHCVDVIELVC